MVGVKPETSMMKFGKRFVTLAAAVALVLGAGATAANAAPGDGFNVSDVKMSPPSGSGIGVKSFVVDPTADGFTLTTSFNGAAKGTFEFALGVYPDDPALDYESADYHSLGAGFADGQTNVSADLKSMSEAVSTGGHWGSHFEYTTTVALVPNGNYVVVLFDLGSGRPEFLAGSRVSMTVVAPYAPTFDPATGILDIPDSEHFLYLDEAGNSLAPGGNLVKDRITVTAIPKLVPGFIAAPGNWEWIFEVAPPAPVVVPPVPPVTPPAPPVTPPAPPVTPPAPVAPVTPPVPVAPVTPPAPVAPGAFGPDQSQLTAALEGAVSAPAAAVPGGEVTIMVGSEFAGQELDVYVFSDPTFLGRHTVAADGTVTVTLPKDLTGAHRLAVYDGATLIGWNHILIDDITGNDFVEGSVAAPQLARTGSRSLEVLAPLAIGCLIAGTAGLLARRRTPHRGI